MVRYLIFDSAPNRTVHLWETLSGPPIPLANHYRNGRYSSAQLFMGRTLIQVLFYASLIRTNMSPITRSLSGELNKVSLVGLDHTVSNKNITKGCNIHNNAQSRPRQYNHLLSEITSWFSIHTYPLRTKYRHISTPTKWSCLWHKTSHLSRRSRE